MTDFPSLTLGQLGDIGNIYCDQCQEDDRVEDVFQVMPPEATEHIYQLVKAELCEQDLDPDVFNRHVDGFTSHVKRIYTRVYKMSLMKRKTDLYMKSLDMSEEEDDGLGPSEMPCLFILVPFMINLQEVDSILNGKKPPARKNSRLNHSFLGILDTHYRNVMIMDSMGEESQGHVIFKKMMEVLTGMSFYKEYFGTHEVEEAKSRPINFLRFEKSMQEDPVCTLYTAFYMCLFMGGYDYQDIATSGGTLKENDPANNCLHLKEGASYLAEFYHEVMAHLAAK